jgi:hypothetical protein
MDSNLAPGREGCDCVFVKDCDYSCSAPLDRLPNKKISVACAKIPPVRIPQKGSWPLSLPVVGTSERVEPRNAKVWREVASFLDAQWLASLNLRRTVEPAARKGPACGKGPGAAGDFVRLAV